MTAPAPTEFPPLITEAVHAAIEVSFESIFGEPPASLPPEAPGTPVARVASVISFFGIEPWALTMIVPEPTAVAMALKFTGFEVTFDSSDMGDVMGELTNVMAGEVIAQLARRSLSAQMSLPTVARGNDVEMLRGKGAATQRLSFDSSHGHFWFELSTAPSIQRLCRTPGTAA
jgi:CheY-specific phosphatase CheX